MTADQYTASRYDDKTKAAQEDGRRLAEQKCCGQYFTCNSSKCIYARRLVSALGHQFVDGKCVHCGVAALEVLQPFGEAKLSAPVCPGAPVAAVDPPKPVNPKDGLGILKLPLHLWPASATAHGSLPLLDGLLKYGRMNWRGTEVRASVYVDALLRHAAEWMEGQDVDAKSGLHPLAHALACIAIILDAKAAGTLVDDRNYPGGYAALAELLTPHVARLQALYADMKAPHHWTIQDTIAPGDRDVSSGGDTYSGSRS
jgi:Domain of unknown function (DUF5664)